MQNTTRNSLNRDFIILTIVAIFVVFIGLTLTFFLSYQTIILNNQHRDKQNALYIENSMAEAIIFTSEHLRNIATKIQKKNAPTITDIEDILISNIFMCRFCSSAGWVDKKNRLVINSLLGILNDPIDFVNRHPRKYLKHTVANPDKLFFSEPVPSIPSVGGERLIIPIGLGVKSYVGEFLGTLASGIDLYELQNNINHFINNDKIFAYVVLDEFGNIVLKSDKILSHGVSLIQSMNFVDLVNKIKLQNYKEGDLDAEIKLGPYKFKYFYKVKEQPFYILTGIDQSTLYNVLKSELLLYFTDFIIIVIIFVLLLFYYRKRVVNPLLILVNAVDNTSKDIDTKIPNFDIHEIDVLASQVKKVKNFNTILQSEVINKTMALENSLEVQNNMLDKMVYYLKLPLEHINESLQHLSHNWSKINEHDKLVRLRDLEEHSVRSYSLINSVAELRSSDECPNKAEEKYIDIVILARNIIKKMQNHKSCKKKAINIKLDVQNDIDVMLYCIDYQIEQVFNYLLHNSIQYSFEPISIIIKISLFKQEEKSYLMIDIMDNGVGIPIEEQEQVFKPFVRSSRTTLKPTKGLGLAFCKKIIEQHNGKIWIDNSYTNGTKFIFILPYNQLSINKGNGTNSNITFKLDDKVIYLSARESECAYLLFKGKSLKEIALVLNIAPRTVETHINNIKAKVRVNYKTELIALIKTNSNIFD